MFIFSKQGNWLIVTQLFCLNGVCMMLRLWFWLAGYTSMSNCCIVSPCLLFSCSMLFSPSSGSSFVLFFRFLIRQTLMSHKFPSLHYSWSLTKCNTALCGLKLMHFVNFLSMILLRKNNLTITEALQLSPNQVKLHRFTIYSHFMFLINTSK